MDAVIFKSRSQRPYGRAWRFLPELGHPPVYAAAPVARALPNRPIAARPLPLGGGADVLSIAVETGRNGHAPGGNWLHFGVGGGFLYTGDYLYRSCSFMTTTRRLKTAATALIDCSYGDYQKPLAEMLEHARAISRRAAPFSFPRPPTAAVRRLRWN